MAKLSYETLSSVLSCRGYSQDEVESLIEACKAEEAKNAENKTPSERKETEYVIVVHDPDKKLPKDLTGWIIKKVPAIKDSYCGAEHAPANWGDLEVEDRLTAWGHAVAEGKKFNPLKYNSMAAYMYNGSKKLAKEYGLNIVSKTPVFICGVHPDFRCTTIDGIEITTTIDSLN